MKTRNAPLSHRHAAAHLMAWMLLAVLLQKAAAQEPADAQTATRNPQWATPLPDKPGLPNLHQVSDGIYRGAQPSEEGMAELVKMGVKTVINLRWLHSDKDEIGDLPLKRIDIPMQAWDNNLDKEAVEFLKAVTDPANQPVFFHCQHGADRTGTMCAIYRMAMQGWSAEDAVAEMTKGGFNFHSIWRNLPAYLKALDIETIRQGAAIAAPAQPAAVGAE